MKNSKLKKNGFSFNDKPNSRYNEYKLMQLDNIRLAQQLNLITYEECIQLRYQFLEHYYDGLDC